MTQSKRLQLPTPGTCGKYSIEAARNARDLRTVAAEAAKLEHFGAAVALEILALEEAAKGQALGMRAIFASLHPSIRVPGKGLEDVLQRRHGIRYRFAAWQIVLAAAGRKARRGPRPPRPSSYRAEVLR
jgi:AbiV family abortive infection protein